MGKFGQSDAAKEKYGGEFVNGGGGWRRWQEAEAEVKPEPKRMLVIPEWRRLRWRHPQEVEAEAEVKPEPKRRLVPQPPQEQPPAWLRASQKREQESMASHLGSMAEAFTAWGEEGHEGGGIDEFLESIYKTMREDQAKEAPQPRTSPRPERWGTQKRGTKRRAGRVIQLERLRKVLVQDLGVKLE